MRDTDKRVIKKCTLVRFSCASALSPSLHHCISKRLGEKRHTHTHTHTQTHTHTLNVMISHFLCHLTSQCESFRVSGARSMFDRVNRMWSAWVQRLLVMPCASFYFGHLKY